MSRPGSLLTKSSYLLWIPLAFLTACGASDPAPDGGGGKSGNKDDELSEDPGPKDPGDDLSDLIDAPPTANCGDGKLDDDEACDDGNKEPGDGCHSNCRVIDPGYTCPTPGEACRPYARCGDGIVVFPEQCDDGNLTAGDGCSKTCKVEIGFKCAAEPQKSSTCTTTVCGDGKQEGAETCDDGNTLPFDGCDQRCQVEPNCTTDGCTSLCGDGLLLGKEECDDGNRIDGDGCSSDCKIEKDLGYKCEQAGTCNGSDPSCSITVSAIYRDFTKNHSDFGNDVNQSQQTACEQAGTGEALQRRCEGEFNTCRNTNQCAQKCSGHNRWWCEGQRDQCKQQGADCRRNNGSNCTTDAACDATYNACLTCKSCEESCESARSTCSKPADDCLGGANCDGHALGIAAAQLDKDKKPQLAVAPTNACIQGESSYKEWFRDVSGKNATIVGEIPLFSNGAGGFVNRYGVDGKKWEGARIEWCSDSSSAGCGGGNCSNGQWLECSSPCKPWGNEKSCALYGNGKTYDGNPVFFPIDDHPKALPEERYVAKIPATIYEGNWDVEWSAKLHNFYFTSEVTHWFQYNAGKAATLTFIGDDDVWVFLNGHLLVDLGGIHVPLKGELQIAANGNITSTTPGGTKQTTATALNLKDGGVYEIKVFHAERKRDGSSFQLTLSGFDTSRSECTSTCGDGIIGAGEECDDGVNAGGYNKCQPGCVLGGYCGDGIKQEHEACDDRDPNAPPNCSGCRILVIR